MDIKHDTRVRQLISRYFSEQSVGLFGTIQAALPIIGSCGVGVVTTAATNAVTNAISNAKSYIVNKISPQKPTVP